MSPPVVENQDQIRQPSLTNIYPEPLNLTSLSKAGNTKNLIKSNTVKPRRRLGDSKADGLDILIQKTKAIGLRQGEEGLTENENGNEWLEALRYNHGEKLLWGVTKIRKYVCGTGSDEHAAELIQFNVLERLLDFLDITTQPAALFEILWIITNIAAGPTAHTTCLVEKGFIIPLGGLLRHPRGNIRTQAAWAIGNIIGDREGFRDLVLEAGLLPLILDIWNGEGLDDVSKRESFRISLWIVDNMCRYKPDWQLMKPAFEIIPNCLQQDDPAILKECCWAVARILHQSGRNPAIDAMINPVFCSRLVEIYKWNNSMTTHPILRALINLSSSKNPIHLKYLVNTGIIPVLEEYLVRNEWKNSYEIFVVQILGNFASKYEYADIITGRSGISHWIIGNLNHPTIARDNMLRNEIAITLRNILYHQTPSFSERLAIGEILVGTLKTFLETASDKKLMLICLESLESLVNTRILKTVPTLYAELIREAELFPVVLNVYIACSGQALEEMEHIHELGQSESEDDEEEEDEEEDGRRNVSFDISNPFAHQRQRHNSNMSLQEKIANKSLLLLRFIFPQELANAIRNSQQDSAICLALNDMGIEKHSETHMDLLLKGFSNLSPTK